ncbi:hypothetical protein KR009_002400 [Drosophila setifemur]|nr:hypothetical protein KR009_002400 [Drosophila setifemur]
MLRLLILLGIGVVLGLFILGTQAECNVCASESGISCLSDSSFQFCSTDGKPIGSVYDCPTGYYCTGNRLVCDSNPAFKACSECGACDVDNTFACLTANTFALCLGTTSPSQLVGSCGSSYVCDRDNPKICGLTSAGSQATCSSGSDSTLPGVDPTTMTPTEYCAIVQQTGRYPYGVDLDTTCRMYIYCTYKSNVWSGTLYNCPGHTYFNSTARYCANICVSPTLSPTTCLSSNSGNCGSTTITNATEYCQTIQTKGKFPYGGDTSTTCKQYVYCYIYAGVYYGNVYSCPGSTYFDSTSQLCTTQTQARCSDTVQCLNLQDRLLP